MAKRTPPSKVCPDWTEAKVNGFIRGALREGHNKWPPMHQALAMATRVIPNEERKERGIRHFKEVQCNQCKGWSKLTEKGKANVQVDHKDPAGTSLSSWDAFIARLFIGVEGYQVLCLPCHLAKTAEDRKRGVKGNG